MANGYMTPAERLARAQALREQREARLNSERQRTAAHDAEYQAQQSQEKDGFLSRYNDNFLVRYLETAVDNQLNLYGGALKAVEGLLDTVVLTSPIVRTVSMFDEDFRDGVQEFVARDLEGEYIERPLQPFRDASFYNDSGVGRFAQKVNRSIGQMLPSVVLTIATGGGAAVGLATTGLSAAGTSTEEAYNEGAGYYDGQLYGAASGAVEVGTEKLFGGVTKNIFGKGILDDVGKSIADTGVKRVVKEAVQEGGEEIAAELANPGLKTIYKGRDALEEYTEGEYWKGVGEAGLAGAATSVVYGGTVGRLTGGSGRSAEIGDSLSEIEGLHRKQSNLFANDKLTEAKQGEIRAATEANIRNIEKALKKSNEHQRAKLIEQFGLSYAFDEEGSVKPEYTARVLGEQVIADGENTSENTLASADKRYYSPDLWRRPNSVSTELNEITADLRAEYGDDAPEVEIYEGELDETEKTSYVQSKRLVSFLSGKTQTGINIVLTKANPYFNGAKLKTGNTIYLSADTLRSGTWAKSVVHEVMHFAEGSKEYAALMEYFYKAYDGTTRRIGKELTADGNAYGFNEELFARTVEKLEKGELLVGDERQIISELNARLAEEILANEDFINRIVREKPRLSERIMKRIHDLIDAFKRLTNKEARIEYNRLRKAEKLYLQAVEKAGLNYVAGKIAKIKGEMKGESSAAYRDAVDPDLLNFVDSVDQMENKNTISKRKHVLGKISEKHSAIVESVLSSELDIDIDVSDYTVNIDGSAIKHIEEKHGSNGTSDHSMENKEDVARIGWVVNNADSGYIARTQNGNVDYSTHYKNRDGTLAPKIILEKFIGDGKFVVAECVPDTAAKKIHIISARKIKSGNGQVLNVDSNESPQPTSETLLDGITATDSISQKPENVNSNSKKSEKVQYSKKDGRVQYSKKTAENNSPEPQKFYTKGEVYLAVNSILSDSMNFGDKYGGLDFSAKKDIIQKMWYELNAATSNDERETVAKEIASYIIEFALVEEAVLTPEMQEDHDTVAMLRQYLRSLDLSNIHDEIKQKYGSNVSVYSRWGKRKKSNSFVSLENAAKELREKGYRLQATTSAEILFEIDEAYQSAKKRIKKRTKALKDELDDGVIESLKAKIEKSILSFSTSYGSVVNFAKIVDKLEQEIGFLRTKLRGSRQDNDAVNTAISIVKKLKTIETGEYHSASEFNDPRFREPISKLSKIEWRGNLKKEGLRKNIRELSSWYSLENELFKGDSPALPYQKEISEMMIVIANGTGELTTLEVKYLNKILPYFLRMVESYNKAYRNGQYVDALPIVKRYIRNVQRVNDTKVGFLIKGVQSKYMRAFADPISLMRCADQYDENGFYTETFREFQRGAIGVASTESELMRDYRKFFKTHKKFADHLEKDTVEYRGREIPINLAISLYMTTKRAQAWKAIVKSGLEMDVDGKRVAFAALSDRKLGDGQIKVMALAEGRRIYEMLTDADREYIKLVERILNKQCSQLKQETDLLRLGYTNVILGGYYYPIVRAQVAKSIDQESFLKEMDRVSHLSMNKDTVEGAAGILLIRPVDTVFTRHVKQVALYKNLAVPIDNFNRLFNFNIGNNPNVPETVKSVTEKQNYTGEMNKYLKKMIEDLEGIGSKNDNVEWWDNSIRFLRSSYAKFQLGLNPKVLLSQFSSFASASNLLDADSILKGLSVKNVSKEVDKWCELAHLRSEDNTVARALSVVDKTTGKLGDLSMALIGKTDRLVISCLFGACQIQVEKNGGEKLGTEENKKSAGELLERVILETQQNALATERSAAMRSDRELLKSFTMFSADSMKVFGRVIDAFGEMSVLKRRIQTSEHFSESTRKSLKTQFDRAQKRAVRSTTALVVSAAYMAAIAFALRWAYRKEEEKEIEESVGDTIADFFGNMIGGLPILRDVYSFFSDGYELDNFVLSSLNDLLDTVSSAFDLASRAVQDRESVSAQDVNSTLRKVFYSAGQVLGIPTRNVYNFVTGITKRISPSTGYWIDARFYNQNYSADLQKAIEADDEKMIATISGLIVNEKIGVENKQTREALRELASEGYSVLPRTLGDSVTYDGEEIKLTANQKKRFREIYSASDEAVEDLIKLQTFQGATSEDRAKAVRFIYDTYYNLALDELMGEDSENKNVLFAEAIDIEKLALIVSIARGIKADTDRNGKTVSGSKKSKIVAYIEKLKLTAAQKYMIMGYLGYTNLNGEDSVRAYINRLNLSATEKAILLAYSGYESKQ